MTFLNWTTQPEGSLCNAWEEMDPYHSNFDIRLVQPNENDQTQVYTIEHLSAMLIRKRIDGALIVPPLSRTGFHTSWGQHSSTEIVEVIKDSLEEIASALGVMSSNY